MTPESGISYQQLFPWLNLFRAITVAVSFRQLFVAVCAVCALGVIDWISAAKVETENSTANSASIHVDPVIEINLRLLGSPHFTLTSDRAAEAVRPWSDLVRPLVDVLGQENSFGYRLATLVRFLWSLIAWSFFGLILCRLSARRMACEDEGSFPAATQFGITRCRHAIAAPLIPMGAAMLLIVMAILVALPGRVPWIGPLIVMVVSPMVLVFSLVAAFLIGAGVLGWPLMVSAIAYDDCDGFGGLSRSYSLWTGRPWQFIWYWVVAGFAGMIALFLVGWLADGASHLASLALQSGMGGEEKVRWMALSTRDLLVHSFVAAYGISYFWTSSTIIYALLRQSVDRVPFHVVAPDDDERPERDPLPVVGMPAVGEESKAEGQEG